MADKTRDTMIKLIDESVSLFKSELAMLSFKVQALDIIYLCFDKEFRECMREDNEIEVEK